MEETSTGLRMFGSEITALKEALFAQQQLLQKLYNELDVERESSATAASEALSMILRLQGEKAAVKMEANQYTRLAEEKMCHAEEALAIFEDLIYQKEMEIASLEYQVQAYKYKLLSLGCNDIGVCETRFPENLLQRNENLVVGEMGAQSSSRRNSMPLIPLKLSYQKKGSVEKERSVSPELVSTMLEENMNCESNTRILDMEKKFEYAAVGDINSYWEQIRKLDERVREIADCKEVKSTNLRSGARSSSLVSKGGISTKSCQINCPEIFSENEATVYPSCASSVHDVFEVPQINDSEKVCGERKLERELILEVNERDGKPDTVSLEALKSHVKGETDWVKKMFSSKHQKSSMCEPSERVAIDCHLAVAESNSNFQQLNRASEITEIERDGGRQETTSRGEEELKLLKEIQEQLNSIQCEIKSLRTMKPSPSYELPLLSVTEAMLHFWL